jgi:hypothetical protein
MCAFDFKQGELVRESEWMRVYRVGPNEYRYVSKFLTDQLTISVADLKNNWENFTEQEQLDFAQALQSKHPLTREDHEILGFLMRVGPEFVWVTISPLLPRYPDKEQALLFLLERIAQKPSGGANYYQALELMHDGKAIPILRERYEEYRQRLAPFEQHGPWSELTDYQSCCRALWKLSGSAEYESALRENLTHPDENIRRRVKQLLSK